MEILSRIINDHESIRGLIEDIRSEYSSPEAKLHYFREAARLAEANARAENATILAFAHGDPALRAVALECSSRQTWCEELANRIRQTEDPEAGEQLIFAYCAALEEHLGEKEAQLLAALHTRLEWTERREMCELYLKVRNICLGKDGSSAEAGSEAGSKDEPATDLDAMIAGFQPLYNEAGRIGYLLAWMLGVPAWVLFMIFMIRG